MPKSRKSQKHSTNTSSAASGAVDETTKKRTTSASKKLNKQASASSTLTSASSGQSQTQPTKYLTSEEFKAKNARARELILATIEPDSEAYRIASSYELASDIWKALEARYAPKTGSAEAVGADIATGGDGDASTVDTKTHQDKRSPEIETANPEGLTSDEVDKLHKEPPFEENDTDEPLPETEDELDRKQEARLRAIRALKETMPNRDQRFLWAILHGGTPETEAWFNGTDQKT